MRSAGAKAKQERNRKEMRDAILSAARSLIEQDGVHGLSMRAVAREIGYSPAALYEYFPSKEKVCCALYFEGAGGLAARMRSALESAGPGASHHQRMRVLAIAYRAYALEQPELYQLAFGGAVAEFTPDEDELESGKEAFLVLVGAAQSGVESGEFQQMPAEAIALSCWAGVHGFVLLELSGMLGHKTGGVPDVPNNDMLFEASLQLMSDGFMSR